MTEDEIIRMAREAGFLTHENSLYTNHRYGDCLQEVQRFAALVAAAEREACAKVCEEVLEQYRGTDMGKHAELVGDDCAAAIRARGQGLTHSGKNE